MTLVTYKQTDDLLRAALWSCPRGHTASGKSLPDDAVWIGWSSKCDWSVGAIRIANTHSVIAFMMV